MKSGYHPREQGDKGELSAMQWLVDQGYKVCLPVGHCPDFDLVAVRGEEMIRVEVKTCGCVERNRFSVSICTRGGNQSWSGVSKLFTPDRCDYLFVLCSDGRRWFIPAAEIGAVTAIRLGGPKYAAFEVERGAPFLAQPAA